VQNGQEYCASYWMEKSHKEQSSSDITVTLYTYRWKQPPPFRLSPGTLHRLIPFNFANPYADGDETAGFEAACMIKANIQNLIDNARVIISPTGTRYKSIHVGPESSVETLRH
jgi:hypothetical protein